MLTNRAEDREEGRRELQAARERKNRGTDRHIEELRLILVDIILFLPLG